MFNGDSSSASGLTREAESIVHHLDEKAFQVLLYRGAKAEPEVAKKGGFCGGIGKNNTDGLVFCLLRMPLATLRACADNQDAKLELDGEKLKEVTHTTLCTLPTRHRRITHACFPPQVMMEGWIRLLPGEPIIFRSIIAYIRYLRFGMF